MEAMMKSLEITVKGEMSALADTAHSFEHVRRVVQIATFLAEKEKADTELVQAGALLHDEIRRASCRERV